MCLVVWLKGGGGRDGGGRVGVVFGSISCPCSTFTHYQSLTRPDTFKTMFNIVYELASFKTIGVGGRVGAVFGSISCSCSTFTHYQSLSRTCLTLSMNWLLSRPLFVVGVSGGRG